MVATNEAGLSTGERRRRREMRSAWLRLLVLAVLVLNLLASQHGTSILVHWQVIGAYGLATIVAVLLSIRRTGPSWSDTAFVVIDALLVVALFHAHLFAPGEAFDHSLTAPSLAVGFLLLMHVALRLKPALVVLFSSFVLTGWLTFLAFTIAVHANLHPGTESEWPILATEGALAAAFAFAAFVCYLLIKEHNLVLAEAVGSERRRQILARFFSPSVVAELQANASSLTMVRRQAVVMFVDLRSFTRLSETSEPEVIAELLSEYRQLVIEKVFEHGGTIDKFIGDGVMAVFGHPDTRPNDAAKAVDCAIQLTASLDRWHRGRASRGQIATKAGIGLHAGPVIGGVLESGQHSEFTVFGDAVNVAQRLERLCRTLDARLVISEECLMNAPEFIASARWNWKEAAELDGRRGRLRVAYVS